MVRLVVVVTVGLLACGPWAGLAGDIQTVTGGPAGQFQEAVAPPPDLEAMQEIDRLLEKALEEQQGVAPEAAGPGQDNQEERSDGGPGK